jgi:hypothetical protein
MTAALGTPRPAAARPIWAPAAAWAALALAALLGARSLGDAWAEGMSSGHDFVQDYAAILKIAQGRSPYEPYNDVTQALFGGPPHRGNLYSFHAPTSLPFFLWLLPFDRLAGYPGAFVAWGVASLLGLWALCWLTLRHLGVKRPALAGGLAALALVNLPAIRENFEEGQLNVLVMAGTVGCWAAHRSGRPILAGALLGAAFALKPIPGLFFLYYLWRREWRLLLASAAVLVVLGVAGIGLAGIEGTRQWATVNYPDHAGVWPGYPDNSSVRGFFTRIFGPSSWRPRPPYPHPYAAMLLTLAASALLAGLGWLAATRPRRLPRDHDLELAALAILTLLVTPIVWPHYYVVLVMPLALVAARLWWLAASARDEGPATVAPVAAVGRGGLSAPAIYAALAAVLALATAVLATAHYVEPFRGVGGQRLIALLAIYAVALLTLYRSRAARVA